MAVASEVNEKIEPSMDSLPSSPSVPVSEAAGSEASSPVVTISGTGDPSDLNDHSDSASSSQRHYDSASSLQRKDIDVLMSPAYLKSEEYRLLFRLPSEEVLVQDFNCAFQESILLQGHMYLFARHICFYSNIFGFETKKTIPFQEVTCVRKAKTAAIFPNAIEIVSGGKKLFFASFLSRDEAYRLIVDGWSQSIDGSKVLIDHQDVKSEIRSQDDIPVILEEVRSFQQPMSSSFTSERSEDANVSGECKILSNVEEDLSISTKVLEPQTNGEVDTEAVVDAECMSPEEPFRWKTQDADAPKVLECFTKVADSKFPIQIEEFFNLFFSDSARSFTESFHGRCGDKDFRCTTWYDHEQGGHSREVSFQHPIKLYFGAKFGSCNEIQKLRAYRNSHLVIETSQEISDVPYGDYFRVEGLWVVEGDGTETNHCCILRVYVNVAFSKKTMWKGKIEQSTVEECREAYAIWLNNAHECLKQKKMEKINDTGASANLIQSNVPLEGHDDKEPLESSHDTKNLPHPVVISGSRDGNSRPVQGDLSSASFSTSLFSESLTRFCSSFRSQIHIPLVLVVAFVSVLLLMQLSIVVLLTRAPQVHIVAPIDYMNGITSSRGNRAENVAWVEKHVHDLKDEMTMVEARLENMRQEYALLKLHVKALEQLKE